MPDSTAPRKDPPRVRPLAASELKTMIDRGDDFVLMDVRTPEERTIACIDGSRLLDRDGHAYLMSLDRETTIVFQCHHGIRSQAAAEYCLREGFRNLFNLTGGIEAWSLEVDPDLPRY